MGWGKGIVLVFIAFVSIMVTMVTICVKQDDIHLVTQNYYEEEIKYQTQMEKISNASNLDYEVLAFDQSKKWMELQLPEGATGTLHLFRPSDARLDQKFNFTIESMQANGLDLSQLKPGYWRVKLSWNEGGTEYFEEQKIYL
jgi:hypothetical protein